MELEEQGVVEPEEGSQPEPAEPGAAEGEQPTEPQRPIYYTPEELSGLTPTGIDIDRVDPAVRPIVENTIRDYKELQADHTKKAQELAELKKAPPEPEVYFSDPNENTAFQKYLERPADYLTALSMDIAKHDSVVPDDGIEEYREARRWVAYLNGVKDRFLAKRIEITENMRKQELLDAKLQGELGEQARDIINYGKEKGFTEKELKSRPVLLDMIKKEYLTVNAPKTALKKEVKPTPQKAATPAGEGPSGGSGTAPDTSKMSDAEWWAHKQRTERERIRKQLGG